MILLYTQNEIFSLVFVFYSVFKMAEFFPLTEKGCLISLPFLPNNGLFFFFWSSFSDDNVIRLVLLWMSNESDCEYSEIYHHLVSLNFSVTVMITFME